jgi:NAD(P)-dependent dehydrogenase (short-subunit alcohol dehydrogenase family)
MKTSEIFAPGKTAVITGASSGIGKAAAIMCASKGMHVFLVDIDQDDLPIALDAAKQSATSENQLIISVLADVSKEQDMKDLAKTVYGYTGIVTSVNFLMNNAAIQNGGGAMAEMERFHKLFSVNTLGPIHGCQAFLPLMREKGEIGLIVNTGSKQGITAPPGNLIYNVSKAALKTWTEGLEHELRTDRFESGGKIYSALLIPGWVNTSIHLKERKHQSLLEGKPFDKNDVFFHEDKPASGAWMPMQVIDFMLKELNADKFYILCPDNEVDRETDNVRMTWAMQDITQDRPPLSRWHPDWKEKFTDYLHEEKQQQQQQQQRKK